MKDMAGGRVSSLLWLTLAFSLSGFEAAFFDEEKKPSFYRAAVGEAVIFNCHIDFPHDVPIPYILNWNKEGETIFSSYESSASAKGTFKGRIKPLTSDPDYGKGSINLTNIRETDGGWYECQILYPNRSPITHHNGSWFHLKVDGGNVIAIPPINQTTVEGERARFPCCTKENSSTVVWKKDGVRLSNRNHNFPERYTLDSEGTLTISPTVMDDLGEFTCEATNLKGEKQSASAFLNVQYKAKVIEAPKEIYLPYGRSAVIDCHFRSNPPLVKLRWEKDGFLFDPYNVQGVVYKSNGSLFFDEVKEEHGGSYTCTPYNELGTEGPSPKMNVIVLKQPVFTITPQMLYIRRRGETLNIPCDAIEEHGIHKPNISWLKDGKVLPKRGNLTLSELREEDRGVYQCIASNAVDSIFAETEVMIENTAPRAPYQVQVHSTEDSLTVKWKSGLTKPRLEFSVWHRETESMYWKFMPMLSPETREFTIVDLRPGTEYEVMVLSKDIYGEGMFSKSVVIKTKGVTDYLGYQHQVQKNFRDGFDVGVGGNSMASPQNINVNMTEDGWIITWDPPDWGLDPVDHYRVQWLANESAVSVITKDPFLLVRNSFLGETHRFLVSAVTEDEVHSENSVLVIHVSSKESKIKATAFTVLAGILIVIILLLLWLVYRKFGPKT